MGYNPEGISSVNLCHNNIKNILELQSPRALGAF